jgi:hypothetical protein
MRLSAGQGSAMLNCEGYTKDREEYDLDQDIERNMGGSAELMPASQLIKNPFSFICFLKGQQGLVTFCSI